MKSLTLQRESLHSAYHLFYLISSVFHTLLAEQMMRMMCALVQPLGDDTQRLQYRAMFVCMRE